MKSNLVYVNRGGTEVETPSTRDVALLGRREFIRRSSLFLPLAFFAGSALTRTAKASSIINRTIAAGSQNAIQMSNSTFARAIVIPATWSWVRIGMRAHWANNSVSLTNPTTFAMGLNSGITNQYGSASCQNFVGLVIDSTNWANLSNVAYIPAGTPGANPAGRTRVGTTNTSSDLTNGGDFRVPAQALTSGADRAMLCVDLVKGSPNFTLRMPFSWGQGGIPDDMSASNFLLNMQVASVSFAPGGASYPITGLLTPALAVSEGTNGTLNAINLYWNRADCTVEVCDIAVAVLA